MEIGTHGFPRPTDIGEARRIVGGGQAVPLQYTAMGPWGTPAGSSGVITLSTLYAIPFYVDAPRRFSGMGVGSIGVASSFIRLGLYADNGMGKPRDLITDLGQIDTATNGKKIITFPTMTISGLVWAACVGQGVAPSVVRYGAPVINPWIHSTDYYSVNWTGTAFAQTGITGALPTVWGATYTIAFTANTIPMVWMTPAV